METSSLRLRVLLGVFLVGLLAASAVWARLLPGGEARALLRLPPAYSSGPGINGDGPPLGAHAPDFNLRDVGGRQYRLSRFHGRPVVLAIGSYTCDFFKSSVGRIDHIRRRFGDKVSALVVYTAEAHATDGRRDPNGSPDREIFVTPATAEQRRTAACKLVSRLRLEAPVLLDSMDNRVFRLYGVASARLYVLDSQGRVAYKSSQSPVTFHPETLDPVLADLIPRQQ